MASKEAYSSLIRDLASKEGFFYCGYSKAEFLEDEAQTLDKWISNKMHGSMEWFERNFDKRVDPRKLVPGSKSVISLALNYFPNEIQNPNSKYKISKYAYGKDYHKVIKKKLKNLVLGMKDQIGDFNARIFVDSAPVLDKAWAKRSGMGWMGKHSNIISKDNGSFFFIAEIICDLELEYNFPIDDYCGSCTKCIDACPTNAIVKPYLVDGSKCISYLTIELKDSISNHFKDMMDDWMFGCDVCQDVCPWNRFSKPTEEKKFLVNESIKNYSTQEWEEITEAVFDEIFAGSAVKRTKFSGLKRNIEFLNSNLNQ